LYNIDNDDYFSAQKEGLLSEAAPEECMVIKHKLKLKFFFISIGLGLWRLAPL